MVLALALLASRLLLVLVFAVSGVAKLADRPGTRQAMIGFGVPRVLAGRLALALPWIELGVASFLIPGATASWGGLGGLVLLLAFTVAIGINLALGRHPDCHCFGQLHSAPLGWSSLVRNGILSAAATLIVWQGSDTVNGSVTLMAGRLMTLSGFERVALVFGGIVLAALAAQTWFSFQLLRQQGRLLLRIEALEGLAGMPGAVPGQHRAGAGVPRFAPGLPIGAPAPPFSLPGLDDTPVTLDAFLAAAKPVLLLFSDPGCAMCSTLLPDVARWQREHAAKLTIAILDRASEPADTTRHREHGLANVGFQKEREIAEAYKVTGTPTAILVRADGTIGSPLAPGADAVRALLGRAVGLPVVSATPQHRSGGNGHVHPRPAPTPALKLGDPAPTFALPDLGGNSVDLAGIFQRRTTLLLFWNPGCGFCQRMVGDLTAWEAKPPAGGPALVVVSRGSVEENQRMGFRSPVVLDEGFRVASAFGANGTPSAVLVHEGKLASGVAVGAPAVMALARDGASAASQRQ